MTLLKSIRIHLLNEAVKIIKEHYDVHKIFDRDDYMMMFSEYGLEKQNETRWQSTNTIRKYWDGIGDWRH